MDLRVRRKTRRKPKMPGMRQKISDSAIGLSGVSLKESSVPKVCTEEEVLSLPWLLGEGFKPL